MDKINKKQFKNIINIIKDNKDVIQKYYPEFYNQKKYINIKIKKLIDLMNKKNKNIDDLYNILNLKDLINMYIKDLKYNTKDNKLISILTKISILWKTLYNTNKEILKCKNCNIKFICNICSAENNINYNNKIHFNNKMAYDVDNKEVHLCDECYNNGLNFNTNLYEQKNKYMDNNNIYNGYNLYCIDNNNNLSYINNEYTGYNLYGMNNEYNETKIDNEYNENSIYEEYNENDMDEEYNENNIDNEYDENNMDNKNDENDMNSIINNYNNILKNNNILNDTNNIINNSNTNIKYRYNLYKELIDLEILKNNNISYINIKDNKDTEEKKKDLNNNIN